MGLKEELLRGIFGYGFKEPSPIQQKGILPVIQGKDTIAQVSNNYNTTTRPFCPPKTRKLTLLPGAIRNG